MIKQIVKFKWIFVLAIFTTIFACDKNESISSDEVENYVDEAMFSLQEEGNCGKFGCYEFVFPLTIAFTDGTTQEIDSYDALRDALKSWKEANSEIDERPTLVFPIEVISEDGEVISVADRNELRQLHMQCRRTFFNNHRPGGHQHRGQFCFSLVFPLELEFADGTRAAVNDRMELKETVRAWKAENTVVDGRPEIVFPIEVELEDGTIVEVDSKDALHELKVSCGTD